jgi:hypothetical protein
MEPKILEAEGLKETKPAARGRGKKNPKPKPEVVETEPTPQKTEQKISTEEQPKVENKYAPKQKIGKPTLGRSPAFVEKVGLGGLKVIHNGRDPGTYS